MNGSARNSSRARRDEAGRELPPLPVPFSPALLFGLALGKLPLGPVQVAANLLSRIIRRRHPALLERMAAWSHMTVCIDPIDLPFVILLRPDAPAPRFTVRRGSDSVAADATIHGSLDALIALAEGRVDGDTLFFSRELSVEGDTEVVVALRNAVDDAGIDLVADVSAAFGPFARPIRSVANTASGLAHQLGADLATLGNAAVAPALRASDAQSSRIAALEAELVALRRTRNCAKAAS